MQVLGASFVSDFTEKWPHFVRKFRHNHFTYFSHYAIFERFRTRRAIYFPESDRIKLSLALIPKEKPRTRNNNPKLERRLHRGKLKAKSNLSLNCFAYSTCTSH